VYELQLVYRVNRLSRHVRQLAEIAEHLDRSGVALRSATEQFDTSTAAGKMMLQMLAVFAEFERTTIVERIAAGMERAASQGRWVVGSTPFGHTRDLERKEIVPDPSRVDVVRRIFRLYAEERMGAEAIAKILNAEGHRCKNGVPFARPKVLWILRNPVYVGKVVYRGKVHAGRHERVVDEQTFEAVQAILAERGESQALKRGHPSDYMLLGVLRCGAVARPTSVRPPTAGRAGTGTTSAPPGTDTAPESVTATDHRWKLSRKPWWSRWPRSLRTRLLSEKPRLVASRGSRGL